MIQIDDTLVSLDLLEENFCCDLQICRGKCCVEGDAGAPLTVYEVEILESVLPEVLPFLPENAKKAIEENGVSYIDDDGEPVTMLVDGCECAFAYKEENGTVKCAVEKAYNAGKISFYKPVSCHLYPVRLQKYKTFTAVNYHRWNVCECARILGQQKHLPAYKFLKEPLIRRFGSEWYTQLETVADEINRDK